jgi:hypothetical protein
VNDVGRQRDLDRVAVAVQIAALAFVIRQAMAGVEFESARDSDFLCGGGWSAHKPRV